MAELLVGQDAGSSGLCHELSVGPQRAGSHLYLISLTDQRNALNDRMIGLIEGAESSGQPIDPNKAKELVDNA